MKTRMKMKMKMKTKMKCCRRRRLHRLHRLRIRRRLHRLQHRRLLQNRMNPNPIRCPTVASLLNSLFYCEFLSFHVECIANHVLNHWHKRRNDRIELTAGRLHLFFASISLCTRACICEKWDEAAHSSAWICECAPHFGTVPKLHPPAFACFQFHAGHPVQFVNRHMLTRANCFDLDTLFVSSCVYIRD